MKALLLTLTLLGLGISSSCGSTGQVGEIQLPHGPYWGWIFGEPSTGQRTSFIVTQKTVTVTKGGVVVTDSSVRPAVAGSPNFKVGQQVSVSIDKHHSLSGTGIRFPLYRSNFQWDTGVQQTRYATTATFLKPVANTAVLTNRASTPLLTGRLELNYYIITQRKPAVVMTQVTYVLQAGAQP